MAQGVLSIPRAERVGRTGSARSLATSIIAPLIRSMAMVLPKSLNPREIRIVVFPT
jgi:hypothetical protein